MERLRLRLKLARDALATLEDALPIGKTRESRDVAILRFTYTCEATWKAAQAWLDERGGLQIASPKAVARECFRSGLFSEEAAEAILRMLDDRNAAVHVYDEGLAKAVAQRVPNHAKLLRTWVEALGNEA